MEKFKLSVKLHCQPKDVFVGWFNNEIHSAFTGSKAITSHYEGGKFSVCNGYVTGTNVTIIPYKRISQKWRTKDFSPLDRDSDVELFFIFKDDCTTLVITHTNLPEGEGEKYFNFWKSNYFQNMKRYFEAISKK